jgi:hypothetical protein
MSSPEILWYHFTMSFLEGLYEAVARIAGALVPLESYDIESEAFAEGAYGTVYRGVERDPPTRKVAIKRQYPLLPRNPTARIPRPTPMN